MNYYNYFTEIEEHFVRRRGKHLLVSPMDWHLIASWRTAGVPLHIALRGIDIAMDSYNSRQGRGGGRVNSLCYCHDAVMEAHSGYMESRVGEAKNPAWAQNGAAAADESRLTDSGAPPGSSDEEPDEFGKEAILSFLAAKISEIETLLAKQYECIAPESIERVLERLRAIAAAIAAGSCPDVEALERDLGLLDDLLLTALRAAPRLEELKEWEDEAKKDKILKVYKKQLPKESYGKMLDNFFRDKIRKKFHVGELSLFRM